VLDRQGRITEFGYTFIDKDLRDVAMSCQSTKHGDLDIVTKTDVLKCVYHQMRENEGSHDPRLDDVVMP
jgi:hypothetical protein